MILTVNDLIEPYLKYMVIFTNLDSPNMETILVKKRNLLLSKKGFTCCWKMKANRQADKVILYIRENGNNKIYIGDFIRKEIVPEDNNRYKVYFENLNYIGITHSNWKEFMNSNAQTPVQYK